MYLADIDSHPPVSNDDDIHDGRLFKAPNRQLFIVESSILTATIVGLASNGQSGHWTGGRWEFLFPDFLHSQDSI